MRNLKTQLGDMVIEGIRRRIWTEFIETCRNEAANRNVIRGWVPRGYHRLVDTLSEDARVMLADQL